MVLECLAITLVFAVTCCAVLLLAIKSMGGESSEAWRTALDDVINRGLQRPEFLIVDGAPGLDKAIAGVWDGVPVQRCTVHKHRNLLAPAPERDSLAELDLFAGNRRHDAVLPPLTAITWPVMNEALAEAANTMASAIPSAKTLRAVHDPG